MPANIVKTPKEERMWSQAKLYVSKSNDKPESQFTDQDWGLVTNIFKSMKAKYGGGSVPADYPKESVLEKHVGKEFTYKGKQMIALKVDKEKNIFYLAPLERGKPNHKKMISVPKKTLQRGISRRLEQMDERKLSPNELHWQKKTDDNLEKQLKKLDKNWSVERDKKNKLMLVHKSGRKVMVPKRAKYTDLPKLIEGKIDKAIKKIEKIPGVEGTDFDDNLLDVFVDTKRSHLQFLITKNGGSTNSALRGRDLELTKQILKILRSHQLIESEQLISEAVSKKTKDAKIIDKHLKQLQKMAKELEENIRVKDDGTKLTIVMGIGDPKLPYSQKMISQAKKIFEKLKQDLKRSGAQLMDDDFKVNQNSGKLLILIVRSALQEEKDKKLKKKCKDCKGIGCYICDYEGWVFAPFFGKGDGKSAAEINTGGKSLSPAAMTYSPAFPGAGGINSPTVAPGTNLGMGPVGASKSWDGDSLFEDVSMIAQLAEAGEAEKKAMFELSRRFFDVKTKYRLANKQLRGGYVMGYDQGEELEIERDVFFDMDDQIGNFMERQVNLSMPRQRLQTAVKVKNLIADVLDGTLQVNDDDGTTSEFIKLAKAAVKGYPHDLLQPQPDLSR